MAPFRTLGATNCLRFMVASCIYLLVNQTKYGIVCEIIYCSKLQSAWPQLDYQSLSLPVKFSYSIDSTLLGSALFYSPNLFLFSIANYMQDFEYC